MSHLVGQFQAHPWFKGIEWDKLYQKKAAFIPEVNDELDTQNFEKFEEVWEPFYFVIITITPPCFFFSQAYLVFLQADNQISSATKSGPWRKVGKRSVDYVPSNNMLPFCWCQC